jgi:hypothetical protein
MEITRAELERIYRENTVKETMRAVGIRSPIALYRLLERAGIEKKRPDKTPRQKTDVKIIG